MLTSEKLNESFSIVHGSENELRTVWKKLSIQNSDAYFDPLVKIGRKDPCTHFAEYDGKLKGLKILNGHLQTIGLNDALIPDYSSAEIHQYLMDIIPQLPFKPYDFQLKCMITSLLSVKKLALCCTGSGKSLIIALMLDFFVRRGQRCLLLVPNINLLVQFRNDIISYNLDKLVNEVELYGDGNKPTFDKLVTISTWQSMVKCLDRVQYDVIIADECHRIASDVASLCPISLIGTKYRFGFTGTLPEDEVMKFRLLGIFGQAERFIRARDLIDRNLGTPIEIRSVIFTYLGKELNELRELPQWSQKLKFLKEYKERNEFIVKLSCALRAKNQNTLVLFSHTEHGKELFRSIMAKLFPDILVKNTDITGKKSLEFQQQFNVFFINGEDDSRVRELTRRALEENKGCILVANYALLSTGVNIKQLDNLVFASPLKAYTTITQSIGRGIRKCEGKKVFRVYDLVDNIGIRRPSGVFYRQYQHRVQTSYEPEGYDIKEMQITFGSDGLDRVANIPKCC